MTIQRSALAAPGMLTEIGRGGEGIVFDVAGMPGVVYKEYLPRTGVILNRDALERMIDLPRRLPASDQQRLATRSAWPSDIVVDGDRIVGYLMPRIPEAYWRTHGARHDPRKVACDWNYLTHRAHWQNSTSIVSDVPRLNTPDILRLIADLAGTMAILHRNGIVMGDISGKNLLWTDRPGLDVYAIDCDAFRPEGANAVNAPKESPDWGDPAVTHGRTDRASDVYKLGLAAYRALWSQASRTPPLRPGSRGDIPEEMVDLIWRSLSMQDRPNVDAWVRTTRQLIVFGDRPIVALHPSSPQAKGAMGGTSSGDRTPPANEEGKDGRGRPVIPVR